MLSEKEIINSKIGIVAHDAGGANYIKSFMKFHKISSYLFTGGPAKKILNGLENITECFSIEELITKIDILIIGSGWESNFEIKALSIAKKRVTTITILDHWTNYLERFSFNNEKIYPDIIFVFDQYAYEKAKLVFPVKQEICLLDNYYLNEQILESKKYSINSTYILYVDEPIKAHVNSKKEYDYDEFQGINFFLKYIEKSKYFKEKILIRLHPSEVNKNKYFNLIKKYSNISISKNTSLVDDIMSSKFVIGFESMALVVSTALNKSVYNIIPPKCKKSSLPHKEIKNFYNEL